MDINSKYYIAFASDESIGSNFVKKLYDFFGDIEQAWFASTSNLYKIKNLSEKKIKNFVELREKINPDLELEKVIESGISFTTYQDENYPKLLREISDPPMTLFYIGNEKLFNHKYNVSVVGSRKCSDYSKSILKKIISEFKNTDLCITSGLALGIDETAHRAALENNLATIAVLGSGLKNIYPYKNKKLFQEIIDNNGLVISEYPINAEPIAYHFPQRNRIVSGISTATLVAEAALKSGALITARLALEQNKELMCIPGAITNPGTEGIYKLLKEGAGIVTTGQDILNIMSWQLNTEAKKEIEISNDLNEKESIVLNILRQDSLTLDEIVLKTGFQVDDLMIILTRLEIEDYIIQTEGGNYSAI